MSVKYVFVSNNMYNSDQIRPVRWWNKLIGFPGETVRATVVLNGVKHFTRESFEMAKAEFAESGMYPQIMGLS